MKTLMKVSLTKIASVIGITVLLTGCFSKLNQTVLLDEKMAGGSVKITKNRATNLLGAWEYSSVIVTRDVEYDGEPIYSWSIVWSCNYEGREERRNSFWLGEEKGVRDNIDNEEFSEMLTIAEQDISPLADEKNKTEFILSIREMTGCA